MTFKRVAVVLLSSAVVLTTALSFYAADVRRLFGCSENALVGDTQPVVRPSGDALMKKRLMNFAPGPVDLDVPRANPLTLATEDNRSTFAIDVDTASYSYARRSLLQMSRRPSPEGVRVEEWVNAFAYELPRPAGDAPVAITADGARSPFDENKTLLRVALQGRVVAEADRKPANLVFLVDVSGSMNGPDRLPLAKQALVTLVQHLRPTDTISLVTYAGSTSVVLAPTSAANRAAIFGALERLGAGGGTAMGSGMELAYALAVRQVHPQKTTRVIVLTDGDANIGANQTADQMLGAVKAHVDEGVTLTTVGFGMGNYRGQALEQLADRGNGQALYIDSEAAIRKAFVAGLTGTLEVVAKDTRVQVTFDPEVVRSYRLLGYENRAIADADFTNDRVDAGELGSGHQVTALYELELTSAQGAVAKVAVRGARPEDGRVFTTERVVTRREVSRQLDETSDDFRFATAAALGADHLRGNVNPRWSLLQIAQLARGAAQELPERLELVDMLHRAVGASAMVAEGY